MATLVRDDSDLQRGPVGRDPLPYLVADLAKVRTNARRLVQVCSRQGIEIMGVTKVVRGWPAVARALAAGGVRQFADARLSNLTRLAAGGLSAHLLRLPALSQVGEVVRLAVGSFNSEGATLAALSAAAVAAGRRHQVTLMVDLGDRREGEQPAQAITLAQQAEALPGLELVGLATNLACFGGVRPTVAKLESLLELGERVAQAIGRPLATLSGGNSATLPLVFAGQVPRGINQLRLGEGLLLGLETVERQPWPGAVTDAFVLYAEVIECKEKPSAPEGELCPNAFGEWPVWVDRGWRRRAICALGRQDVDPAGLTPLWPGVTVLGATSDHLVLDVSEADPAVSVGAVIPFRLSYGALLGAMSSPDVQKRIRLEHSCSLERQEI